MFDIGFWELVVVGVVALLVIGPDKLPGVARNVGRWVGRARIYLNNVKSDIDREMRLQELQEMLKQSERAASYDILENKSATPPPAATPAPPLPAGQAGDKNTSA